MSSQRKMGFMYDAMKTAVDENPDKIAKLGVGEGAFIDISKSFNRDIATIGLNITQKHCKTINKREYYSVKGLGGDKQDFKSVRAMLPPTPNKYEICKYKEWVYFEMFLKNILNSLRGRPKSCFPNHVNLYSKNNIVKTLDTHGFSVENVKIIGFCLPFFGNLNLIFRMYKSKSFLRVLEYLEKKIEFSNFLIVLRCRKVK